MGNMDSVKKFRNLTNALPPLVELVSSRIGNVVSYKVEKGRCIGYGILNRNEVAVQYCLMDMGTPFQRHAHDVVEVLVVVKGKLQVMYSGSDKMVGVGEVVRFDVGEEHGCRAIEDVELIGITIPKSLGYPDVK